MSPKRSILGDPCGRTCVSYLWSGRLLLLAALALTTYPLLGQVQLKSGTVSTSADTTTEFVTALKAASGPALYGLATFSRHPTSEDRKAVRAAGIRLLSPLQGTTYRVRVEKRLDGRFLEYSDLKPQLLRLNPQDRVEPKLWREEFERFVVTPPNAKPRNYVLNADGTLNLTVRMHAGVTQTEATNVIRKHARADAKSTRKDSDQTWIAIVPRASLRPLATENVVQWIDAGPLPVLQENDKTREAIKVDALQNFDLTAGRVKGLGGRGVQVGIFDFGFDERHGDFAGRVIRNDAGENGHATHIAGIIAGSGAMSDKVDSLGVKNSGSPFRWRGIAPLVEIIDIDQMPPYGQNGKKPATHLDYIIHQGMDISNHSYVFSVDGAYDDSNRVRDEIIRGDATANGRRVPARLSVGSSGNNGQKAEYGTQTGYFALTKQTKNALVVGNWDVANEWVDHTSSLGPAHDGRIKPDVVAPGTLVTSTGYCKPDDAKEKEKVCLDSNGRVIKRQNFYRLKTGSSMATPAATGVIALVLEQYVKSYKVDLDRRPPLPSTLRALMIHTAIDKSARKPWFGNPDGDVRPTPGPDFVTGWGLIDAQSAVSTVAEKRLREGRLKSTCEVVRYSFDVPPGTTRPVRVTLAWDDVAADAARADTAPKLVNDLDLVLIDPNGAIHYPWQLDQRIVDAGGRDIADALQACGKEVTVKRQFMPDPYNVKDTIPAGGVPAAIRGRDHLNNVEVVDAAILAGTWEAHVLGFNIPHGPQTFSLVGALFTPKQ